MTRADRRYKFILEIEEGNDEFWEDIERRDITGIDDVMEALRLDLMAWNAVIRLASYTEGDR